MRVLHIITGLGVGGAEQQLLLLLRRMAGDSRIDPAVVTLTNPGPVAAALRADGIPVTHLGMRGNRDAAALPRLVRLVGRGRYDLVHTHLYRACVYGRIAARLAGVRTVVATEHSLGTARIEGRPLTRGTRALYLATERLGAGTVAVSDTVAARLCGWGVPAARVQVVPNGIDAAAFRHVPATRNAIRSELGLQDGVFTVGGVGRLVPGKRFDVLVTAVARLPQARLVLVGDGPERAGLARLAAELGAGDRVSLLGERSSAELAGLLAAMDVLVSPSGEEAFGLAVLEGLAAGLPVLHVTCPALDDLPPAAAPGATRVGPTAEDITTALRRLAEAGVRRLPVPLAVHQYDIAHSAERLLAVYEGALRR